MCYEISNYHAIGAVLYVLALIVGLLAVRAAATLATITVLLFAAGSFFMHMGGF